MLPYPVFDSREAYAERFTDVGYWQPYIRAACEREGLPCHVLRPGLFGTNPVYIVDELMVVKLFTPFFGGPHSVAMELALYRLLPHAPEVRAPRLLASGQLFPAHAAWSWPYLCFSRVPGVSLGECRAAVSRADLAAVAQSLGPIVRRLHALPVDDAIVAESRQAHVALLYRQREGCAERHRAWSSLPQRLVAEVEHYLPPASELATLFDRSGFRVGHCDLNQDHVLGEFDSHGRWHMAGIIDFGDACACDRVYDLTVIHLGLFLGDVDLLRTFLSAYGADAGLSDRFTYRAMCYTLLHQHNLFDAVGNVVASSGSLEDLAHALWGA